MIIWGQTRHKFDFLIEIGTFFSARYLEIVHVASTAVDKEVCRQVFAVTRRQISFASFSNRTLMESTTGRSDEREKTVILNWRGNKHLMRSLMLTGKHVYQITVSRFSFCFTFSSSWMSLFLTSKEQIRRLIERHLRISSWIRFWDAAQDELRANNFSLHKHRRECARKIFNYKVNSASSFVAFSHIDGFFPLHRMVSGSVYLSTAFCNSIIAQQWIEIKLSKPIPPEATTERIQLERRKKSFHLHHSLAQNVSFSIRRRRRRVRNKCLIISANNLGGPFFTRPQLIKHHWKWVK